jgi:hypothetical protein
MNLSGLVTDGSLAQRAARAPPLGVRRAAAGVDVYKTGLRPVARNLQEMSG